MLKHFLSQTVLVILLFTSYISSSQTLTITGVITDALNIPLESANIIANPLQEKAELKFAIADNKGRYKLELDKEVIKNRTFLRKVMTENGFTIFPSEWWHYNIEEGQELPIANFSWPCN